jgi:hypothetical protein
MSGVVRLIRAITGEALPVGGLLVIAAIDYLTGPRVAVSPFYLAVLVVIALRRRVEVAVAYGAVAATFFLIIELLTVPALATTPYPYWRGVAQLISFSVVMFTIPRLIAERHRLLRSEEALVRQRTELEDLNAKLVGALEELGAARQRTVEDVLGRHTAALDQLKNVLASALAESTRRTCAFNGAASPSTGHPMDGGSNASETL